MQTRQTEMENKWGKKTRRRERKGKKKTKGTKIAKALDGIQNKTKPDKQTTTRQKRQTNKQQTLFKQSKHTHRKTEIKL